MILLWSCLVEVFFQTFLNGLDPIHKTVFHRLGRFLDKILWSLHGSGHVVHVVNHTNNTWGCFKALQWIGNVKQLKHMDTSSAIGWCNSWLETTAADPIYFSWRFRAALKKPGHSMAIFRPLQRERMVELIKLRVSTFSGLWELFQFLMQLQKSQKLHGFSAAWFFRAITPLINDRLRLRAQSCQYYLLLNSHDWIKSFNPRNANHMSIREKKALILNKRVKLQTVCRRDRSVQAADPLFKSGGRQTDLPQKNRLFWLI